MIRITLEEITWELYKETGGEVLDALVGLERDVVQLAWGISPYKQNSFRAIAKFLGIPRSTAYSIYRRALRNIKRTFKTYIN